MSSTKQQPYLRCKEEINNIICAICYSLLNCRVYFFSDVQLTQSHKSWQAESVG